MKPSLVIVGLGNPGKSYTKTRHNLGFRAVDLLSDALATGGGWQKQEKFSALIREGRILTVPILFVKPQTYMNLSGESVKKLVEFYKLDPKNQLLVISDDIDLPLGTQRLRKTGSAGTHNGLKSIVEHIGEEFPRLRLGIGPKPEQIDLAAWVVSALSAQEESAVQTLLQTVEGTVRNFVLEGSKES